MSKKAREACEMYIGAVIHNPLEKSGVDNISSDEMGHADAECADVLYAVLRAQKVLGNSSFTGCLEAWHNLFGTTDDEAFTKIMSNAVAHNPDSKALSAASDIIRGCVR